MPQTTALLLVGGQGSRLRPVLPSRPKPLALIGDMPFLELLVLQLRNQGIRRLVMCTGHMADQIEEQFGDGHAMGVEISYSREQSPLGTGGAVRFARWRLEDATDFVVMNGDSFVEIDFHRLIEFHRAHGGVASMAVRRVADANRYGTVRVDSHGRVTAFEEKAGGKGGELVNAGVYVFKRAVADLVPGGVASLERDVIPGLLDRGVYALELRGAFIDIGTPEDYARAQALGNRLREAALKEYVNTRDS